MCALITISIIWISVAQKVGSRVCALVLTIVELGEDFYTAAAAAGRMKRKLITILAQQSKTGERTSEELCENVAQRRRKVHTVLSNPGSKSSFVCVNTDITPPNMDAGKGGGVSVCTKVQQVCMCERYSHGHGKTRMKQN